MAYNMGGAEMDQFGNDLQNQLFPVLEAMTQKLHQLDMDQVRK